MYKICTYFMLALMCFSANAVKSKEVTMSLLVPRAANNHFWQLVEAHTVAAAESLNVSLTVKYVDNDRFAVKKAIETLLKRDVKPDYLLFRPFSGNAKPLFHLLEQNKLKFVTLEQAHINDANVKLGKPGEQFNFWVGEVLYDDMQAGVLLAETLLNMASEQGRKAKIVGLGGRNDYVSRQRNKGLIAAVESTDKAELLQIFTMNWDALYVRQRFEQIANRYPEANIFWCSSDFMALEARQQALKSQALTHSPLIGGIDWMPRALKQIKRGIIDASVGGHMLMGALAVIKTTDYHNGVNRFADDKEQFSVVTAKNVDEYLSFIEQQGWKKVDFNQFLHHNNPEKKVFSFAQLLAASKEQ